MPNSDWVAPERPRQGRPGRHAGEPAQGALAGDLRRRRHPRHRRGGLDRHRRLARLRAHAHPRRDRPLRPGAGRRPGLHRLARRRAAGSPRPGPPPSPARAGRHGGRRGEESGCRCTRPSSCLRMTANHIVDASPVPWTGATGAAAACRAREAGLDELALGGDLTRGGVDEERGHRHLRLVAPARPPPRRGPTPCAASTASSSAAARPSAPAAPTAPTSASWPPGPPPRACAPADIDYPALRRWAARISAAGVAPSTLARKLASVRAFFRTLVEHGELAANPADLLAAPKQPQRLPRTLKAHEVSRLLDRIPATTPLELRDRAMFELAYGCGLRAEELVNLDLALDRLRRRAGARRGQGRQDALRARRGAGAARRSRATWSAAAARSRRDDGRAGAAALEVRAAGSRPPTCGAACGCGRATPRPRVRCTRTPCGTPSRPTFSRAAPICGPFRSCSGTAASRPPRSTLG